MQHIEQMPVLSLSANTTLTCTFAYHDAFMSNQGAPPASDRYTLIARDTSSAADFPEMAIKTPESGDKPDESR